MMNEIIISPQELMYLAVKLGAVEFFGLPDPFMGMTPEEIRTSLDEAQLSLDQKGYAQMDFSGGVQVDSNVESLVRICAFCSGCISVDRFRDGESVRLLAYVLEDHSVVLSQASGLLRLFACEMQQAQELLAEAVGGISDETVFSPVRMEYEQLNELRAALAAGGQDVPADASQRCEETLRAILADGFGGKSDFALLLAMGFEGRRTDSMMLLRTAAGSACVVQGDDGGWMIRPAARQAMLDWIDGALRDYQREA